MPVEAVSADPVGLAAVTTLPNEMISPVWLCVEVVGVNVAPVE